MDTPAQKLNQYFKQHPPNFEDAESLLDFLYWHHSEYNPIDNDVIKRQLEAMRSLLDLPSDLYDQVFGLVCDICIEHGRLGFVEGLRFGMVLMQELGSR